MFERQKEEVREHLMEGQCSYHKRRPKKSCKECMLIQEAIHFGKKIIERYDWLEKVG